MDRAELRLHLERLDAAVPTLRASSPDRRHFWRAFTVMAAAIESKAATSEDAQFVGRRADVHPILSSASVWSPIPYPEEIGREE
ncbi:hypothetical protein ABQW67_21090, partial [Xanthomonas hortorum]|uniref:hypothetical protein n=1 Tax=Xanthomonas hortorum TaxID=56454 RepID=UPI0032E89C66